MTVTLNLPPYVERELLHAAQARGISLDEWVRDVLLARAAPAPASPSPRQSRLWELRRNLTLGDVAIKDLIAEGRE